MDDITKMKLNRVLNGEEDVLEHHLECIRKICDYQNDLITELEEENRVLKNDTFKDEELKRLREKVENLEFDILRGFSISEEEDAEIRKWQAKHDVEAHGLTTLEKKMKAEGCCGGRYKYIFVPTSIGTLGRVECECGESFTFRGFL